jgi:succinoglycan biosynthesis protein ExoM
MFKNLDICVVTYKRPLQLRGCLRSIVNQKNIEQYSCKLIVVDNDIDRSGEVAVADIQIENGFDVKYIVQPQKNIALARNAALDECSGDVCLFIDDDEEADQYWVQNHLNCLEKYNADCISGTVHTVYPQPTPEWMRQSRVFEHRSFPEGEVLSTATTANVSFIYAALNGARFDPEFGLTGGSDTKFFKALSSQGLRIVSSDYPSVSERMPSERFCVSWALLRGYRVGQGHTRVYCANRSRVSTVFYYIKVVYMLAASTLILFVALIGGRSMLLKYARRWFDRVGRLTALFGVYYVEYKI